MIDIFFSLVFYLKNPYNFYHLNFIKFFIGQEDAFYQIKFKMIVNLFVWFLYSFPIQTQVYKIKILHRINFFKLI